MFILNRTFSRISYNLNQVAKYSINVHNSDEIIFKTNFTKDEQTKILNILNDSSYDQLSRLNVSQTRIKNLNSWKSKKGPFKSLHEVLEVDGLEPKILKKLCERIITEDLQTATAAIVGKVKENKKLKHLLIPPLNRDIIVTSAVGIHLGPVGMSWAKLQNDKLVNWNYKCFTDLPKKMFPNDNFNLATGILKDLPPADVYIFEASASMSPQSTKNQASAAYLQQLEVTSMLLALLNTSIKHNASVDNLQNGDERKNVENRVYHLRSKVPARLFKTLVGNERVSAIKTISSLLDTDNTNFTLPCTKISFEPHIKSTYNLQAPANKELLGQALLLVISFMDLCVNNNPSSYAAITPNRKHDG